MSDHTLFGLGAPPAGFSTSSAAGRENGVYFTVSAACTFKGFYFYCIAPETNLSGANYSGTLFTASSLKASSAASTVVPNIAGSGTFTASAWNSIPCTPVTLSPGTIYVATVTSPNGFAFLNNFWFSDLGGGGAGGITSGPVNAPSAGPSTASTANQQPHGSGTAFPATAGGSWYGMDIQVADIAGASSRLLMASII